MESRALALKQEALEYLSVGLGGTPAAALWDEIAGAFMLHSEQTPRPYGDYSGAPVDEDPFDAVDPAPPIGRPLGYEFGASPGFKPVDHLSAALTQLQLGAQAPPPSQLQGPLLIPDSAAAPATRDQIKVSAAIQRHDDRDVPSLMPIKQATLAYPVNAKTTSATGVLARYLSQRLTAISPTNSLYACTFGGCDLIFKQLAGVYNHLHCCHLGVAIGCYYCSGRWWTRRGWSDHHRKLHNTLARYPSRLEATALLAVKAHQGPSGDDTSTDPEPSDDDDEEDEDSEINNNFAPLVSESVGARPRTPKAPASAARKRKTFTPRKTPSR